MDRISRNEARERGLKRFYTGDACSKGHFAERNTKTGKCCECLRISNRAYVKARSAKDPEFAHHRSRLSMDWAKSHPDKVKAAQDKHEKTDRRITKKAVTTKEWKDRNPDRISHYNKQWRAKNPGWHHSITRQEWVSANQERIKEMQRDHRSKNSMRYAAYINNYRARRTANGGEFNESDVAMLYEEQDGKCAGCSKPKKLEIDHVVPISKGGINAPPNLQLLCRSCNASKSDRDLTEWLHERFPLPLG